MENETGTVEDILDQINALASKNQSQEPERLRLWVASRLTGHGKPVAQNIAMAIVLDHLLGKGFMPDGFTEAESGRWYEYVRPPAK